MKKILEVFSVTLFATFIITSCGTGSNDSSKIENPNDYEIIENPNAYEMMEVAFDGYPSTNDIKPMMESVMKTYNMQVTEENLQKVASMLVSLRKESKVGVTEMEILKHIYQNGSTTNSLPDQAAVSFLHLESTK